jgi:DNA-binding NarL/FixJ family response regulator
MMENKSKILIVDDEPGFTQALWETLADRSYEVMTASNRNQAREATRTKRPDMVVLGTIMPRGDAFLFHKWLRQKSGFSNLPILVINARREEALIKGWRREEGLRCEADDFLTKPVEPAALLPLIEKLLDRVTKRIRVLVADDHAMVREGIRAVLTLQRDMQVVGEAVNGREALEKTVELYPDVVLMDIVMPTMNGLDATREICRKYPQAKVLMLTQYDDEENVLASSQVGALGFIPKTAVSSQLLTGIRAVNRGKKFIHAVAR